MEKNDVFTTITNNNQFDIDTTILRVENGKNIYEWVDNSQIYFKNSKNGMKNLLTKVTQNEVWVVRSILSKGDGTEYQLL